MAGQLGGTSCTVEHLLVYKYDYKRNLLFLKGACAGSKKCVLQIYDSLRKTNIQYQKLLYPTFVPEKGKTLPNIVEFGGSEDLNEKYIHDNDEILGVSDEEEEGEPEKTAEDDTSVATAGGKK